MIQQKDGTKMGDHTTRNWVDIANTAQGAADDLLPRLRMAEGVYVPGDQGLISDTTVWLEGLRSLLGTVDATRTPAVSGALPTDEVADIVTGLEDENKALRAERDLFRTAHSEAQKTLVWLNDVATLARQCPEGTQITITVPDHLAAERLERLERDLAQAGVQRETHRQVAADVKRENEALRSQLAAARAGYLAGDWDRLEQALGIRLLNEGTPGPVADLVGTPGDRRRAVLDAADATPTEAHE